MKPKVIEIYVARVKPMFEPIEALKCKSHTHSSLPLLELDDFSRDPARSTRFDPSRRISFESRLLDRSSYLHISGQRETPNSAPTRHGS
jgi:hypothetical protein